MTRHFTASIALGFCVSFLLPAVSMASAIFTNFGSGQSYNISAGNAVGHGFTFDGSVFAEGSTFTPAANAKFGSLDRKSTRLNSSHLGISYAVFCLKKK